MKKAQDASGSGQGYLYQFLIGLNLALAKSRDGNDYSINLENYDDVSFVDSSGDPRELIQTKHKSQKKNLTDSSIDLWKTLSIWLERESASFQKSNPKNLYYLVTNTKASPNSACSLLCEDKLVRATDTALEKLLKMATDSIDQSTSKFRQDFLNYSDAKRKDLLSRVYVLDSNPNIDQLQSNLEMEFLLAVKDKHRPLASDKMQAWWLKKIVELLQDTTKSLPIKMVANQLQDICYEFHNENLPIDFSSEEPAHSDLSWNDKTFVRQLKLVTNQSERIRDAVVDYYRAYNQRLKWAREELLVDDEVEKYEKKLVDEWRRFKNARLDECGSSEQERNRCGVLIYNWIETVANFPIRKYVEEPYVMRGSFHMLADEQRVGWHPDFVEKLKELLVKP